MLVCFCVGAGVTCATSTNLMPRYRPPELSDAQRAESARFAFEQKRLVLKRYRKLAVEWGLFAGAIFGMLAAGLQMERWQNPFVGWAVATAVLAAIGGFIGYAFYDLLFGSQIRAALGGGGFGGEAGSGGDGGGDGGGGGK
jgi:uncharacterized membrane protein YgcG